MSRIAYVNGRYLPLRDASVSIDDRGYQFGDGVYEVCEIRDAALIDETRHLARLERSLGEVRIRAPVVPSALRRIMREVVARNRVLDGLLYIQITRGVARRDHAFPDASVAPSLVMTARAIDRRKGEANAVAGVRVVTRPDERWRRPDIKTLQLLPNVLAKQAAREQGAYEVWLVDNVGCVTEGASTNAWIVTADGALVTRQADHSILRGVTRAGLIDIVSAENVRFEERAFSLDEVWRAREAFVSSATNIAMPVVMVDGRTIGDGRPGSIVCALRRRFHTVAEVS
jgi:D-alanine transaminase